MAAKLELSLDDIVKQNKKSFKRGGKAGGSPFKRGGKPQGRGGAKGGVKRLNSSSPMKGRKSFPPGQKSNGAVPSGPARLVISNLDFGVNDQDINELFSRCGSITKACVHYDSNGRSQGTAEVVYRTHREASNAVKEYNGRLLDGRAMNVAVVGAPVKSASIASRVGKPVRGAGGNRGAGRRSFNGQANGSARGGRGGKRGGKGGRGGRSAPPSKEDLDKEMEQYRMQTDAA